MINKRVALMSALALGILSIFMIGNSEAATLNFANFEPSGDSRVDANQNMAFTIDFASEDDSETIVDGTFVAVFGDPTGSWTNEIELVCTDNVDNCDGSGAELDGTWSTPDGTFASAVVSAPDNEIIHYGFKVSTSEGGPFEVLPINTNVRVNTLAELTDNGAVTGDDMPYSTRTLSITYTDLDDHDGVLFAKVCEASNLTNCETQFSLTKELGGDNTIGAVYSSTFTTALGGALIANISGSDGFDDIENNRTVTFSVDTQTPWLINDLVNPTSAGTTDEVAFSVVYCVFTVQLGPSVSVDVGGASHALEKGESADAECAPGVGNTYYVNTTIAWSATEQNVEFSVSNAEETGDNLASTPVTINDLPVASDSSARKIDSNFIINVTVDDVNIVAGDSLSVHAIVEHSAFPFEMNFDADSNYTVTIAESAIIDERGGIRTVTFQVNDTYGEVVPADFGSVIEVNRTSSFEFTTNSDMNLPPGDDNMITFTIVNNGNSEDVFTISTDSLNGWLGTVSPVTVGYGSSLDFDVPVSVPFVAVGIQDPWTVTAVAANNVSVENSVNDVILVDAVTGHSLTGDTDVSGDPGGIVTYHFTILNTGNVEEKMFYTISSSWNIDNVGGDTTLGMGESATLSVTQTIPANAVAGATGAVTFSVVNGDSESVTTTANQVYGVTVTAGTLTGLNPGGSGDLSFTVTNTGNGLDTFTIEHSGVWANAKSDDTVTLASGSPATVVVTVGIPADAASAASSSIGISATSSGAASTDSYDVLVASSTRSLGITGDTAYTFNQGTVGQGTATIQNTGVSTTFIVTSMTDSVNFVTSEYNLAAGETQDITFSIMASSSGEQSFTVSDNVDFSSATHTFTLTARTFSTDMSIWGLTECSNSGATCTYDMNSWDGSAYSKAGTWTTTLDYVDANGQTGTHTFDTVIENSNPTVAAPSLDDPVQGTEQLFSFIIPTDADGTITHFVIDFGDGESQTFQASDFTGQTVTATHTYSKSGNFDVVATAYDNSGGSTKQTVAVSVSDEMVTLEGSSYTYNLIALLGFFFLGAILSGTAFKLQQGEIAGDEEMNERDRQRLESVERRMESLSEREELMEVSAYDASRAATKLEEHISAFNSILVKAQEIAAEDKLKELEAAEEARQKEEEEMQLDLEDPDIEMVAERFHESLARLVAARDDLSKIEKHLARILKMERDEQLEKLTEMTESYESTKRKIDALESSKEARDAAAVENNIMNMLSAAASGGSMADADFGDFGDLGGDDEYEVEIYEDEDGSFYYIDPDTGEEVPCDEDGNAL
ncbi:MAG: PKD domain-containing protein [Candidatus Poseidoniales archaeon]